MLVCIYLCLVYFIVFCVCVFVVGYGSLASNEDSVRRCEGIYIPFLHIFCEKFLSFM